MIRSTTCPSCKKPVEKAGNKLYPFCCERCSMADLGKWLNEEYRVPAEPMTESPPEDD